MPTLKRNAIPPRQDVTAPLAAILALTSVDAALVDLALQHVENDLERGLLAFTDGETAPAVSYELLFDVIALRARLARVVNPPVVERRKR